MGKVLIVAAREFLETVRTKAFLLGSVFLPLIFAGIVLGTDKLQDAFAEDEKTPARTLLVADGTGQLAPNLELAAERDRNNNKDQGFVIETVDPFTDPNALKARVNQDEAYAYVVVSPMTVSGEGPAVMGRKDNQFQLGRRVQRIVQHAVETQRLAEADIDPAKVQQAQADVQFQEIDTSTGTAAGGNPIVRLMVPFIFMFLLFMATLGISQGLLTSMIEEKSTRVIELLLSAVSPLQLMAGKIIGMVGVGVLLLSVWAALGFGGARYADMAHLVTLRQLAMAGLYFLPAFLLFSAVLGAIGAACNTLKEAQAMTFPLTIVTVIPVMLWFQISENPAGPLAVALSYVPLTTPFVMILRVYNDPTTPMWQIVTTLILLWATVVVAIWAAARVFRIGVLMYGKPPTMKELLRWVRTA